MRYQAILLSFIFFVAFGVASAGAQDLPEVAVERSEALCGTDPNLGHILKEVHRAIGEHRLQTTGSAEIVVSGTLNVDIGDIAVLEDRGDLVTSVLFVGRGKPRPGYVTDTTEIVQRFYSTHSDSYDTVIIFVGSTFSAQVEPESGFAFSQGVRNDVLGIGLPIYNDTALFGLSTAQLKNFVNMNDLGEYTGPTSNVSAGSSNITGVEILGQEVEHRWGAFVNTSVADILGRGDAHWSFFLNSDDDPTTGPGASVMEGNGWVDNGDGSFTTTRPFDSFFELDEYIMGLRGAAGVGPMLFVKQAKGKKGGVGESNLPAEGVTVTGTARTVTIGDVIAANGARIPEFDNPVSNLAFILVVPDDGSASTVTAPDTDLTETNQFRTEFEAFYSTQTDGLGSVTTNL
ncbi:MAG: hypothetical protein HYY14_05110 [Candidatus Omnitrophica bacterium]|nr:hypothetical protein [Candidatus Omnitrophota bacterium]